MAPSNNFCGTASIIILIHSSPKNTELRSVIRETWGNVTSCKTVFVVGTVNSKEMQEQLEKEHDTNGDLVQANFRDAYRNMTLKHLAGYR